MDINLRVATKLQFTVLLNIKIIKINVFSLSTISVTDMVQIYHASLKLNAHVNRPLPFGQNIYNDFFAHKRSIDL